MKPRELDLPLAQSNQLEPIYQPGHFPNADRRTGSGNMAADDQAQFEREIAEVIVAKSPSRAMCVMCSSEVTGQPADMSAEQWWKCGKLRTTDQFKQNRWRCVSISKSTSRN